MTPDNIHSSYKNGQRQLPMIQIFTSTLKCDGPGGFVMANSAGDARGRN